VFTIRFLPSGKSIKIDRPISILEAARLAGVQLDSLCGGRQRCGKCKVILKGHLPPLSPPDDVERKLLGDRLISEGYRLACNTIAQGSLAVLVPEQSRSKAQIILTSTQQLPPPNSLRPPLFVYAVSVPSPTISDPVADRERLISALEKEHGLRRLHTDPYVVRDIPHVLRSKQGPVRVLVRGATEVVGLTEEREDGPYGVAIDVGTTTVVAYLVDLLKARILSTKSSMNPQIPYGDDIITRISFCQQTEGGLQKLHSSLISCANSLITEACNDIGISHEEVMEVSVVGNTAMHHFFLGINPQFLSFAPYAPAISSAQEYKARDVGLKVAPSGYVYFLPVKAGFVGSDAVACVLSTRLHRSRLRSLVIDIGTNGEIAMGDKNRIMCCSTAAGPAFEGGHIKWGMRAASGAINQVRIDPTTLEVGLKTIHNRPPIGICGSGLISAVAELIRTGCILQRGNFNHSIKSSRLRDGEDGDEFVLSWKDENPTGHDIVITQKDIAELQMAKGAIRAGISIMMESFGPEIRRIYLAGAGGNFIDSFDAQLIDLIPSPPNCQIIACGNAAGHGACLALVDMKKRREAQRIAGSMEYIELASSTRFQDLFVSHMFFSKAIDS